MIADCYAMGVATQIAKDLVRAAECGLGVNNPILSEEGTEESGEGFRMSERTGTSGELQPFATKCTFEPGHKLASEDSAEHSDRQEEGKSRGESHFLRSGESPPAGTTQCRCGWRSRFCPQVCRMARKPMRAPRCFGSAATSSIVS